VAILFISGVNDQSLMGVNLDERGNLVHLMDGNCSVQFRLPLREGVAGSYTIFGKGVRQQMPAFRTPPSLIFNQIADADTHRGALERCAELCDQTESPVINHPRHVLATTRDQVASRLQGIPGVIMPRTLRFRPRSPDEVQNVATAESFEYPYILRVAGDHQGKRMLRIDRPDDHAPMHALPFDGRDFYLMEYVDCQDQDGLFHKQRVIVVDGEPMLRHALYLNDWVVHADSRSFVLERETWEQDVARFEHLSREVLPQFRPAIDRITQQLQLQYYGIDCNLSEDGRMVVFEANANMNVLHAPNAASRYRVEIIQKALYALLSSYSGEQVI
jgi:glutathione synthase/RimK-type ligase-like ATP-grasp enzyme